MIGIIEGTKVVEEGPDVGFISGQVIVFTIVLSPVIQCRMRVRFVLSFVFHLCREYGLDLFTFVYALLAKAQSCGRNPSKLPILLFRFPVQASVSML